MQTLPGLGFKIRFPGGVVLDTRKNIEGIN